MKNISVIPVVLVGFLLIYASVDFPEWGDPQSPASTGEVSSHFIAQTGVDTEVPNMVTAVLADYRGFDTMLETVVVFIAGMAVLAILRNLTGHKTVKRGHEVTVEPDLIVTNTNCPFLGLGKSTGPFFPQSLHGSGCVGYSHLRRNRTVVDVAGRRVSRLRRVGKSITSIS